MGGESKEEWDLWCHSATTAGKMRISVHHFQSPSKMRNIALTGLNEASKTAYGALIFSRAEIVVKLT